jgi:hypothetical protein
VGKHLGEWWGEWYDLISIFYIKMMKLKKEVKVMNVWDEAWENRGGGEDYHFILL